MSKEGQYQSDEKQYQMPNVLHQKKNTKYRNSSTGIDTVYKNDSTAKADK